MKLGAVLIAAGAHANPMEGSGRITVAQRMIASLQKAGVTLIAVVTGPADKKMEKQLSGYGVVFLRNPEPERERVSIRLGLEYLSGKCQGLYLMAADCPLVLPETLLAMQESQAPFAIPTFRGKRGQLMLVQQQYARKLWDGGTIPEIMELPYLTEVPVEDPGCVLTAGEAARRLDLIEAHERRLTRLIPEFSITRGTLLVDGKLVELLRLIRETQSVRDACCRMQISYSTAWNVLNGAEESLGYPLILRNKGGPSGSGSLLTEKGRELLSACDGFEAAARESLDALYGRFFRDIL